MTKQVQAEEYVQSHAFTFAFEVRRYSLITEVNCVLAARRLFRIERMKWNFPPDHSFPITPLQAQSVCVYSVSDFACTYRVY